MKKLLFAATLNFAFAAMVFTACHSKQEKVEDGQEQVNEAKVDLQDAKQELNAEYPSYRQAQEDRINMNQKRIDDLRAKINTGGKPLDEARQKRIQELEEKMQNCGAAWPFMRLKEAIGRNLSVNLTMIWKNWANHSMIWATII